MTSLHSPALPGFAPFAINDFWIGSGRCYVIAEAGSNHDRDLAKALALVDVAADAGCDAVKFQTFVGKDIAAGQLAEVFRGCALPKDFHRPLFERAVERDIAFLSSAFSEWAVDFLCELGVPALKIASYELVHLPLIRHAAASRLPLILSTGLAGLGDIERALEAADQGGCRSLALMHCGSDYPLRVADVNLAAMETMRCAFDVPVGYSDHTLGLAVPTAAAALGADLIEKHFTTGGGDGPDHAFALKPQELAAMVNQIIDAQQAVGSSRKQPARDEIQLRFGRRSLYAARDLKAGEHLRADAVKVVRPGHGLEPLLLGTLLGRPLMRDLAADQPMQWDDFLGYHASKD